MKMSHRTIFKKMQNRIKYYKYTFTKSQPILLYHWSLNFCWHCIFFWHYIFYGNRVWYL